MSTQRPPSPPSHEDDLDEGGNYDHMAIPIEEFDYDGNEVRENTPRRRAILRELYSKLGQLSQLRTLNMSYCKFRVRVKDGLELALPGLQQNLIDWKLDLGYGYQMGNSELEFFGKHFGYGHDFTIVKNDGQGHAKVKTRKAQLKHLLFRVAALERVRPEVLDWAKDQGFHLDVDNGFWYN